MPLFLLKLGGSLITLKSQVNAARHDVLDRICSDIARCRSTYPDVKLIVGHGSGSFGHIPARKYKTRDGVSRKRSEMASSNEQKITKEEEQYRWNGFAEVWHTATSLTRIVIDHLRQANLPCVSRISRFYLFR